MLESYDEVGFKFFVHKFHVFSIKIEKVKKKRFTGYWLDIRELHGDIYIKLGSFSLG